MGFTQRNTPPAVWSVLTAAEEAKIPATPTPARGRGKRKPVELVAESSYPRGTWTVPYATVSESNGRDRWARNGRVLGARRAVSRLLGRDLITLSKYATHFHRGGALRIVFTRLGGHRMDRSNLPAAMKAIEDAVALMMGADDGSPLWRAEWGQEPDPTGPCGVRITVQRIEAA